MVLNAIYAPLADLHSIIVRLATRALDVVSALQVFIEVEVLFEMRRFVRAMVRAGVCVCVLAAFRRGQSVMKTLLKHGFKMIVSSVQLIATSTRLQTNLTDELVSFFKFLDFWNFNISIFGFDCGTVLEQYWEVWKLKIFAPFIFSLGYKYLSHSDRKTPLRSLLSARISAFCNGYFQAINVFYTLIISAVVEPFLCSPQNDGSYMMVKNPSVQCFSDDWKKVLYFYIIPMGILWGLLLPVATSILLFKNRRRIESPYFLNYFGFLTQSYRPELYWYEMIMILKKVLFMIVPEFLALKSFMSLKLLSSVIILISFQVHFERLDRWSWALILILLTLFTFGAK